jgi:hypothetical protein
MLEYQDSVLSTGRKTGGWIKREVRECSRLEVWLNGRVLPNLHKALGSIQNNKKHLN